MYTTEVQDKVFVKRLFGYIEESHIRTHRISILVSRPILSWLACNTWSVSNKRIVDVDIDGSAITLRLPVSRNFNFPPVAHVIILLVEVSRSHIWIRAPMEKPFSVEADYLLTLFPFRWQLQCGMIGQFIGAQHRRIFPIMMLCMQLDSHHRHNKKHQLFHISSHVFRCLADTHTSLEHGWYE